MMTLLYLLLLPMLSGIGMLGLGPALMAGRAGAAHVVLLLSGLLLPLRGLMYLLLARRRGNRPGRMSVLLAAVELLLGAGLLLLPQLSVRLFAVVVAVYLTLLVTVEAVNAILYGRMRRWGAFFPAMAAAVGGTGLFVLIVFVPALRDAALRYTAALLLTVFGTGLVCDVLALTIRSRRVRRVLGSIRVALPDLMSLFLPQRTADVLPRAPLGPVPQRGTEEFELLFQTSAHGIGLVGHCELCFDGRTLTYGAYDPVHQRLLRTAGAGIASRISGGASARITAASSATASACRLHRPRSCARSWSASGRRCHPGSRRLCRRTALPGGSAGSAACGSGACSAGRMQRTSSRRSTASP